MTAARVIAVIATLVLVLVVLLASRFAPETVEQLNVWLPDALRSNWFHRLLPPELRVYSILLWVAAVFGLLTLLDKAIGALIKH